MSKERLYIFDTTLRDGAQTQGVHFSIDEKASKGEKKDLFIAACQFVGLLSETYEQWQEFKKNRVSLSETEIERMINLRDIARENKDYKEADRIRDELSDKGVLIEDKDGKTLWKFK